MRIRLEDVDELSEATVRAMRIARRLGGYVVSVEYETPRSDHGDSYLTLRVPVVRAQRAIMRFSSLGTVLGQNIRIMDVQPRVDALERRIVELRGRIGAIDARLRSPALGEAERARLEFRRGDLVRTLREATRARASTIRRAQFATMALTLTTAEPDKKESPPPGRVERMLGDAGAVLVKEAAWMLYVLVVAAPFVLLAALAIWGLRTVKRLADRRLLESS
jgi:hypothetical protein